MYPLLKILVLIIFLPTLIIARIDPAELKGTMIQRIATFIEWPACSSSTISFGIYNDSSNYDKYKRVFASQQINGKWVSVKTINDLNSVGILQPCDIIYLESVTSSERARIIEKVANKGILIVGSTREDARAGVSVVLLEESNRYRILINPDALKASNLKANYRLLKLADIVENR